MAKMTVGMGALLILLGAISFVGTGSQHPTALIPAYFGIALCLCGVLANTENTRKRMIWMHVAVTVGLVGFLGAAGRLISGLVSHGEGIDKIAAFSQGAMAGLCLVFVITCVRSFIAARRDRITT